MTLILSGSALRSKLRRLAVLGGTPQYQVWAGEEQEIRDPATYFAVVRAIAAGRTRVNETPIGLDRLFE